MVYTQSPALTRDEIDSLIEKSKIARISSINKDGTIHSVPVWYYYEDGNIVVATPKKSRRAGNIQRNNNVTILIDEFGAHTKGIIFYGKASIDEGDMDQTALKIFSRYMSKEEAKGYWKGLSELTEWVKVTVEPVHIASFDYDKDSKYSEATKKYTTL